MAKRKAARVRRSRVLNGNRGSSLLTPAKVLVSSALLGIIMAGSLRNSGRVLRKYLFSRVNVHELH